MILFWRRGTSGLLYHGDREEEGEEEEEEK